MKRAYLLGIATVVALTFFYPPYQLADSALRAPSFAGYAWLWRIPSIDHASVAWPLLLVQWFGLAIVAGLVWFAMRSK